MYTTRLKAGLGLVTETKLLLELWEPGMPVPHLNKIALASGRFASVTARRLRNIVVECFASRYLTEAALPARMLKVLLPALTPEEMQQFFLLFTCRTNPVLADFIRQVYWPGYAAGTREIRNTDAQAFVERALAEGKTPVRWTPATVKRMAGALTGCCADYGLLENGVRTRRRLLPFYVRRKLGVYLAYDLHRRALGEHALLHHPDWALFGLDPGEVLSQLKQLSLDGWFVVQAGGDVVRISWKHPDLESVCHVLAER